MYCSGPQSLKDVSCFPNLLTELLARGWKPGDVQKLAGENFLRVWKEVEEVFLSATLQTLHLINHLETYCDNIYTFNF